MNVQNKSIIFNAQLCSMYLSMITETNSSIWFVYWSAINNVWFIDNLISARFTFVQMYYV